MLGTRLSEESRRIHESIVRHIARGPQDTHRYRLHPCHLASCGAPGRADGLAEAKSAQEELSELDRLQSGQQSMCKKRAFAGDYRAALIKMILELGQHILVLPWASSGDTEDNRVANPLRPSQGLFAEWRAGILRPVVHDQHLLAGRTSPKRGRHCIRVGHECWTAGQEATGSPAALQAALVVTGQEGTVAVVSFFGMRQVPLLLSPEFHYRRLRVISSQVSSLGSGLQPRWTRERRNGVAFDLLESSWLETPISHRLPFDRAAEAYQILDRTPQDATGIVLNY